MRIPSLIGSLLARLLFIGASAVACADPPPDRHVTLCTATEKTAFSCSFPSGKRVSLCASADLAKATGYLQYRFGTSPDSLELEYPARTTRPAAAFKAKQDFGAKTATTAVSFHVGAYRYSLFLTKAAFGFNGAGIFVDRAGKRISFLQCKDKPHGSLESIGEDNFLYRVPQLADLPDADADVSYIGAEPQPCVSASGKWICGSGATPSQATKPDSTDGAQQSNQ